MRGRKPTRYRLDRPLTSPVGQAVLRSLRPLQCALSPGKPSVLAGTEAVLAAWRARLLLLADLGWAPLADPWALLYALNCPPAGVLARPSGMRRCRLPICPWCWARDRAGDTHQRLRAAVRTRPEGLGHCESGWRIWESRIDLGLSASWTAEHVLEFVERLRDRRGPAARLRSFAGLSTLIHVEPPPAQEGPDDEWRIVWRALTLSRLDDFRTPEPGMEWLTAEVGLRAVADTTIKPGRTSGEWDLVKPVARHVAYPAALITGDARRLLSWLEMSVSPAGRSPRLLERYGLLRNKPSGSLSDE